MLMNGKEVNHLVINGETFDRSYKGQDVEILKTVFYNSQVHFDGSYQKASWDTVILPGTKGYVVMLKYYDNYYIAPKDNTGGGMWVQASDIKILD